jgi:hypothetical protein
MAVDFDMQPHIDTWHSFIRVATFGLGAVITVLALLAIFLL